MPQALPSHAQVVIIGGGIAGCSVAYHLAKLGWKDVVLLERKSLTCGTTWHAAGLIGQLRATHNMTRLAKYTAELYRELEKETGQATGFKQNGSLSVATNNERFIELKRGASMARCFEIEVEVVTPAEARELWPLLNTEDVVGAIFLPKDGQINPSDVAQALARGAKMGGVSIFENIKVTAIHCKNGQVTGVRTEHGDIAAEYVVNCGGMWAREIGALCGVNIPLHAAEHFYVLTEGVDSLPPTLPVLRDVDNCAYYKEDAGKLLVGFFEPNAKPWGMNGIPENFAFEQLPEDWDHLEPLLEQALHRVPALQSTGIQVFFNGPESFTPDDRYILGEASELKNFYVLAGFNSVGIQSAGGAGKVLAEWIIDGRAPMDLWDVDIRRWLPFQGNRRYLHDRTMEGLGLLYAMHWPFRQYETARPVRTSPFHDRLAARGACFGESGGWERANWFAPPGVAPRYEYSYGRQNWFEYSAAEHRAVREHVGLFDQSSFAKFLLQGRDAESILNWVCANNVSVPVGKVVYTPWLNERGGIEADLTVTRLDRDSYLIVTSVATQTRDLTWLRRHIPEGAHAALTDVTSAYAVLGVMGPKSRDLLTRLSTADLSNNAFPFATSQEIDLAYAKVRAMRITYVGELGWELYIPTEFALGVYDAIVAEGEQFGLTHSGFHAMNSLRIEKGYRHWGHDTTDEDTPLEAGLTFAVAFDKKGGFLGREALLHQRQTGVTRRLAVFALNDPVYLLYHDEPIWRDGQLVGRTTSGMFGHTLGCAVAMGYIEKKEGITADFVESGAYEIEIACRRVPARASLRPLYDPNNLRIKI
ncbi:MAG: FAD-dependent oxidoreductase [Acidiferrobacterales bacterium]